MNLFTKNGIEESEKKDRFFLPVSKSGTKTRYVVDTASAIQLQNNSDFFMNLFHHFFFSLNFIFPISGFSPGFNVATTSFGIKMFNVTYYHVTNQFNVDINHLSSSILFKKAKQKFI